MKRNEPTFNEKEQMVENRSACFGGSKAFRKALAYIDEAYPELYRELIEMEYNEAFGED